MSSENLTDYILPFSYTVTYPLNRFDHDRRLTDARNHYSKWLILDKGSVKSRINYEHTLNKENIRGALTEIRGYIVKKQMFKSSLCRNLDFHIYLKGDHEIESMDSVKIRGVIYTLLKLSDEQKRKGVVAISTGSFAWFLCYYGKKFKIPVTVVMPESTAEEKVEKCRDLGATVIVRASDMVEAHKIALRNTMMRGLLYLDGNDHPYMIIGQATLGIEIFELTKEEIEEGMMQLDAVILPTAIDGCGLTMVMALTIKQSNKNIKVFEVLPTNPDLFIHDLREQHTALLDELSSKFGIKDIPAELYRGHYVPSKCIMEEYFDGRIKVNEKEIQDAADLLLKEENVIDSNAAIGLAAILSGKLNMLKGKRVLLPIYGNMDSSTELMPNRQQSSLEPRAGPSRRQ